MKKYLIIISLLCSSSMHAIDWFRWSKWVSFKRHHETWGSDLRDAANSFKKEHDVEVQESRAKSNAVLADEINKNELSGFFTRSKYPCTMTGIFNTSEVRCVMREILQKKEQESMQANILQTASTESENADVGRPSKIKMSDIRELPHLGNFEANPGLSKFMLSVNGKVQADSRILLRVSLAQRVLGTKQMSERTSSTIVGVPCIKMKTMAMVIGTENNDGTFSWQKSIHDENVMHEKENSDYEKKSAPKKSVSFNEDEEIRFCTRWNFPEKKPK